MIPVLDIRQQLADCREEIDAAVARVLDNCAFCLGPEVEAFECEFGEYVGCEHVVGVNSGTSALHLALRLLDVGPGDEVIIPPMTFIATGWAANYVGAKPVFADIDPETFCLDPAQVEAAITPKTKAVIPVHLYGQAADIDGIRAVCAKHGIPVVEDAAQSHGAARGGRNVGTLGDAACFSFYPSKNLGACGEGGALTTNDAALADRARVLRNHGSRERYLHEEVGYNYRLEGIQAAILRVKLKRLEAWTRRRQAIAQTYLSELADLPLALPRVAEGATHVWHQFVVRTDRREDFTQHLQANGVGHAIHYPIPMHLQPCYAELGNQAGDFPVSEKLAAECLSLPMFAELTDEQVARVVRTVRGFFGA